MEQPVTDKKTGTAHWAVKEVDHLLSRLASYTRFVLYSKWFLLVLAAALLTTLIALPLLSKSRSGVRVSFVDTQTGTKPAAEPVMNSPEYFGSTDKGDQYKITGERAVQVSPTLIRILQVEGQLISPSGGWRSLSAAQAEYKQDAKLMTLTGAVTMMDDQGYTFTTESATVNTATSEVEGSEPIQGSGPLGNLLASSFRIMDNGKRIVFYRGAAPLRLVIQRQGRKS